MKTKRKVLPFDQLGSEMELLTTSENNEINGGMTIADLSQIVKVMDTMGITSLTSSDLENNGLSFDMLLDYSNSGIQHTLSINGTPVSIGGGAAWTTTVYHGSANPLAGDEPLVKRQNGYNLVSFDEGETWQYMLDTVEVTASSTPPTFALEGDPYYNTNNDTLNFQVTTLADKFSDDYQRWTMNTLSSILGQSRYEKIIFPFVTNSVLPETEYVRAAVNDLLIKAVQYQIGARVIPHASGSTTVEVSNWYSGGTQFQTWLENNNSNIYNDMRNRGIITDSPSGGRMLDTTKYNEYTKSGGAFERFIRDGGVE